MKNQNKFGENQPIREPRFKIKTNCQVPSLKIKAKCVHSSWKKSVNSNRVNCGGCMEKKVNSNRICEHLQKKMYVFMALYINLLSIYIKVTVCTYVPFSRPPDRSPPNFAQTSPPTQGWFLAQAWPHQPDPRTPNFKRRNLIKFFTGSTGARMAILHKWGNWSIGSFYGKTRLTRSYGQWVYLASASFWWVCGKCKRV